MKLDEAMLLLQGLTAPEIRDFVRARLAPTEADNFDVLSENVSHEVLLLVSARALTRLGSLGGRGSPLMPRAGRSQG
jgi:hypothetical protein